MNIYSSFIQDRITLVEDELQLTVGTKAEHDHFCGFVFQPSARVLWTPDHRNAVWGSITLAEKTPNRHERDSTTSWGVFQVGPSLISQEAYGRDDVRCEDATAYELGYRTKP